MQNADATVPAPPATCSLGELTLYFLRLGAAGFGGPVALVGYMQRDLVEERGWFTLEEYREGLALAQLAPGPLAAQLCFYLGYLRGGTPAAAAVGIAFVLPSFLMVVALGAAYVRYGGLPWMQAVFYGVGAAVIGIIAQSATRLIRGSLGRDRLLWAIAAVSAATTVITESEIPSLFLAAGALVWLIQAAPRRPGAALVLAPLTQLAAIPAHPGLWKIFTFFTYAGSFVFGSGLAIVPFLYGGVVKEYGWLTEHQFLDAVAVAMITPGPVVITTAFIGFLIAGLPGAGAAAAGTFLPAFLLTVIPAPFFRKHRARPGIIAFVDGVTAAAVGAIGGAVIVLGQRSIIDLPTAMLAVGALLLLWKTKLREPLIVLAAAGVGLCARLLLG